MPHRVQGGKVVDAAHELPVAKNAHVLQDKANALARGGKQDHVALSQPYEEPSARPHPALKELKTLTHVHEHLRKR